MATHDGLELEEDLPFQRRQWVVERTGWTAMAVFLVAGLAGAFGDGPLSNRIAEATDVQLNYERYLRHSKPAELQLLVRTEETDTTSISLSQDYLATQEVEDVFPEPQSVRIGADEVTYVFALEPSARLVDVRFRLRPQDLGWHTGTVAVGTKQPITIRQFTYP